MQLTLKTKISTPEYESTRRFYETVFAMTVVEEWNDPDDLGVILALPGGRQEAFLEIYYVSEPAGLDGVSLQFRVARLDDFMAGLPDGTDYEGPVERPWGSTYLYLHDPSGIQVVVFEGGQ